jgi:hypothetical protein
VDRMRTCPDLHGRVLSLQRRKHRREVARLWWC